MPEFLVIARAKHPIPQGQQRTLADAVEKWLDQNGDHVTGAWSLAGQPGGAVVANVDSLETLDHLVYSYPVHTYSDIELIPLVDVKGSHENLRKALDVRESVGAGAG
jgi:hypothetical protein